MKPRALTIVSLLIGTLSAQTLDEKALGGPCVDIGFPAWGEVNTRQLTAARQSRFVEAAELAKQVVRGNCTNEYWWLRLAETLTQANRPDEALLALDAAYARKFNQIAERLQDPASPLNGLAQTDSYRRSPLAAKVDADRKAHENRLAMARAALNNTAAPPPANYIARGACPGEYCHFGPGAAKAATDLFERPDSPNLVVRTSPGEKVTVVTGEVHLTPQPVLLRRPMRFEPKGNPNSRIFGRELPTGTIGWLLDFLSEGYGNVWIDGKVQSVFWGVAAQCTFAKDDCWGEFIHDVAPEPLNRIPTGRNWSTWWIQVRTPQGKTGWTKESTSFDF